MKTVIAITGMPGSGKSKLGEILQKNGIKRVGMGDAVRKEMRSKGMEITNVSLRKYALHIRKKFGNSYVLSLVNKDVKDILKTEDMVLLDGARNLSEINVLRRESYRTVIIALVADRMTRYIRIVNRGLSSDLKTFREFDWREAQELKFGVAEVIASADYYILNNSTVRRLKKDALKIIRDLPSKK
jgi:dephospho-CoA kinase